MVARILFEIIAFFAFVSPGLGGRLCMVAGRQQFNSLSSDAATYNTSTFRHLTSAKTRRAFRASAMPNGARSRPA